MKISKDLNLVIRVPQEDGSVLHVHSMPIPMSMFDDQALMLSAAMTGVYTGGLPPQLAPRAFAPELKKMAAERARVEGLPPGAPTVYDKLLAEVRRRTMVLVPRVNGHEEVEKDGKTERTPIVSAYEPMLMDEVVRRDMLDETDLGEIDRITLFFSGGWHFHVKHEREAITGGAARFWKGFLTPSNSTEYLASLPTSTPAATSGATAPVTAGPSGTATEIAPDGTRRTLSLAS